MAKRKNKRRGRRSTAIPLVTLAGLALAGSNALGGDAVPNIINGNLQGAMTNIQRNVMENKLPIAVGIIGPLVIRSFLGNKQLLRVGRVRVTTG